MKRALSIILTLSILLITGTTAYAAENTDESLTLRCYDTSTHTETIIDASSSPVSPRIFRSSSLIYPREIIGGSDDRDPVTDPTYYPYHAIVYVVANLGSEGQKKSTGFLISENVVLTAGHSITTSANEHAPEVTVYTGREGNTYTGSSTVDIIYTDVNYGGPNSGSFDWDYAILVLDEPLGETTGWLGLSAASESALTSYTYRTAGFPTETQNSDPYPTMYYSYGTISNVETYTFTHTADTTNGHSGSPIFRYIDSTYGYVAVGIHVASGNTGRRIRSSLIDWLFEQGYIE